MDYDLMYKKLEAARKEIRQNVPRLRLYDDLCACVSVTAFDMLWIGESSLMLIPSADSK